VSCIPSGFTTYFDTIKCPDGWFQPPETQGRLVLSVTSSADAGTVVNEPLAEQEIRSHSHSFNLSVPLNSRDITAPVVDCCNFKGACAAGQFANGTLNSTSGNVPFTQLLLCQISQESSDPIPVGTVAYFSKDTLVCPSGWSPYEASDGRFLVSGYATEGVVESQENPIKSGEDIAHIHHIKTSFTTDSTAYFSDSVCCDPRLADEGTYTVQGDAHIASSGIPYISLLTCVATAESFSTGLPSGTLLFNQISCTPGWNISIEAAGRFLVSTPAGGTPGVSFGGKSLEPGFSIGPTHEHQFLGDVDLASCGVDTIEGITALHYAHAEDYQISGYSDSESIGIPFIAMPLCVQFAPSSRSDSSQPKTSIPQI